MECLVDGPELIVEKIEIHAIGVSERTVWLVIEAFDTSGRVGVGEATLDSHEDAVIAFVRAAALRLQRRELASVSEVALHAGLDGAPGGLAYAAAISGIEQALWDLWGQQLHAPVHALMGASIPTPVRLYANINRALIGGRSASDFADMAAAAVAAGYRIVKCAPFDGVLRGSVEESQTRALIDAGLERVRAVREAIGAEVGLIVDCHYRFTPRGFLRIVDDLAGVDPYWVEAPVAEHRLAEWATIRSATHLRLAGGEMMTGIARFAHFMDATGVDIVMPDVKYVGGITGLRAIADMALARGILIAPHNPSGPVATIATVQGICDRPNLLVVEHAFGECDWRSELVSGAEVATDGKLVVSDRPGFGVVLDHDVVRAHPRRDVKSMDLRLFA